MLFTLIALLISGALMALIYIIPDRIADEVSHVIGMIVLGITAAVGMLYLSVHITVDLTNIL